MIAQKFNLLAFVIVGVLCVGFASPVWADSVYDVGGNFGTTLFTGPLNGGTFSGTFTATLPISDGIEPIATFDIKLYDSSSHLLSELTNTTGGDFASVQVLASDCWNGTSVGSCDAFLFSNADVTDFLELITPVEFTGGAVVPFNTDRPTVYNGSFGGIGGNSVSTDSIVTSGSITAVPEPSSFMLLGSGLVGIGSLLRGKLGH